MCYRTGFQHIKIPVDCSPGPTQLTCQLILESDMVTLQLKAVLNNEPEFLISRFASLNNYVFDHVRLDGGYYVLRFQLLINTLLLTTVVCMKAIIKWKVVGTGVMAVMCSELARFMIIHV